MGSEILLFIIGFTFTSLTGLPDNYVAWILRGNGDRVSFFNLFAGSLGLLLIINDLPGFLKENNVPYIWFFLPFGIAVTVWTIRSWHDRIRGRYGYASLIIMATTWIIIGAVGAWVIYITILTYLS